MIVGIIQGISEECGYYFALKRISNNEQLKSLPFLFGLGRSLLHALFDMGTIIISFTNISVFIFSIISRMFSFAAMMELTKIDYLSCQKKKALFLGLSVLLHAILNGTLYAYEIQLFNAAANFDIWFMIVYSTAVIAISSIICRKG